MMKAAKSDKKSKNKKSEAISNSRAYSYDVLPTPIKSQSDKKTYQVIKLENGLTACLISDSSPSDPPISDDETTSESSSSDESETEPEDGTESSDGALSDLDDSDMRKSSSSEEKMAAAALCVGVGSFSDPKDIQGLAHFLEHMVFMGSEKFPKENDFDSYIKKRGGSDNASTDCETTTFYFEIIEKHLFKALDKFAQFFISPLMKKSAMTREREAIESEFQIALPKDNYRKEQLLCSFGDPESPVNQFSWGNLVTLRDNVTDDKLYESVHEFRKRHYSAHRMTLAIQARLPIDDLKSMVLRCFSDIPSNKLPPNDFRKFAGNVFNNSGFKRIYYLKPTKDLCQVDLTWCLPSLLDKYKTKPHQYVSWLLGDEGKGSLLSYLKRKIWALTIFSGNGESGIEHNSLYALFSINIVLTTEGLLNLKEVIAAVFSYIKLMTITGPQKQYFQELQQIRDISFRFAEEEPPGDCVEDLAEAMQYYPPEDYIAGPELYYEYDPEGIMSVMKELTPDNVNIIVTASHPTENVEYNKKEQWFGTSYTDSEIPEEWIKEWKEVEPYSELAMPSPNKFITTDFSILPSLPDNPEYPQKILDNSSVEVWYRKDQRFNLPATFYRFYLISPLAVESAHSQCKMEMMLNILLVQLAEITYPAHVAELVYSLNTNDRGVVLKVSGFNQKLPILISLIAKQLREVGNQLTKPMFEAVKEKLRNNYYNKLIKPNSLSKDVRLSLIIDKYYTSMEKYYCVEEVTFEDIKEFCSAFLSELYTKILIQGNISESEAREVVDNFIKSVKHAPLPRQLYPQFTVAEVPLGERCCRVQAFNENDSNSLIVNYYQVGPSTIENSVIIELLMTIIEEPLFDILRTKEQLGYHVACSLKDTFGILGYSIAVNTRVTKSTTQSVDERIEAFVKTMRNTLSKMGDKSLNQVKRDLIKVKQCSDVVLKEEVDRNWAEIISDEYMFDRLQQEISAIEKVKIHTLRNWWDGHNAFGSKDHFRKLTVQIVGFNTKEEEKAKKSVNKALNTDIASGSKKPQLQILESSENLRDRKVKYFIRSIKDFKDEVSYHRPTRIPNL